MDNDASYFNVEYWDNRLPRKETWTNEAGIIHRINGPAIIEYYRSGVASCFYWKQNGELHKEDGPALISFDEAGYIRAELYYNNGKYLFPSERKPNKIPRPLPYKAKSFDEIWKAGIAQFGGNNAG